MKEVMWGYAGVYPGEFRIWDGDQTMNQLRFLVDHGFKSTQIDIEEMLKPERCSEIAEFVAKNGLEITVGLHGFDYFDSDINSVKRAIDQFIQNLDRYHKLLNVPIVTTCAGQYHRFMNQPSLEQQMDRLVEVLTPAAQACYEIGCPLGIENHGDYYCSDLVELCGRVPRLGIFLDTGNTYLIGEQSISACRAAAPYTIGTHFKDHFVHPDLENLTFVVEGAPLGAGNVGLREIYDVLAKNARCERLVMQWEMIPPEGMDAFDCLEQSWKFIRSL